MRYLNRAFKAKFLALPLLLLMLLLAACGGSTGSTSQVTLNLGSKKDTEARLISEMYYLLLTQKGGFNVKQVTPGINTFVLSGIQHGSIDLYPEFTSTGLQDLNITPTGNPQDNYQKVKDGFEKQYHITWLDYSPGLNDTYAICAKKSWAQQQGLTTISQLAPKASQYTMAVPPDSLYVFDFLKGPYGLTQNSFKLQKVDYTVGFQSVIGGQTNLNFCYSTDVQIAQNDLVVLQDDKNAFPTYNPAPIVRDSILKANPKIADVLNPLAPHLTNEVSLTLQTQVLQKQKSGMSINQALKETATQYLQSIHLL